MQEYPLPPAGAGLLGWPSSLFDTVPEPMIPPSVLLVIYAFLTGTPVGINLFVIQAISKDLKLETIIKGILTIILVDIVRLALLVAIPGLALWLPHTMN